MEAVACQLVRRDIVPDVAAHCGVGQQVSDEVCELMLRPGDVLTLMDERGELATTVLMLYSGNVLTSMDRRSEFAAVVLMLCLSEMLNSMDKR